MQKNTLSFCLLFFAINAFAQLTKPQPVVTDNEVNKTNFTGVISEDYPNGKPKIWREMVDGKATGMWIEW